MQLHESRSGVPASNADAALGEEAAAVEEVQPEMPQLAQPVRGQMCDSEMSNGRGVENFVNHDNQPPE